MMDYLQSQLEAGRNEATIMSIGGNAQVSLKVRIEAADSVGIVACSKGMMGGWSEPRLWPWACIASLKWD